MQLGFFTEEAYDKLLHSVSENEEKYISDEEWLESFFENDGDYFKMSTVEVNQFIPSYTPGAKTDEQKTQEDLVNTRFLHDAFIKLTPLQASNKYLWTYLCHTNPAYIKYIKDRWMQDKRDSTVAKRFFVTDNSSLLNYNALSRLWWYGHLTYDRDSSNHYALTEVLLTNQTVAKDIMDTLNHSNFRRMKGYLLAIKEFKEELNNNEGITDYIRDCNKYLNQYAAVTKMEFLDSEEIKELAIKQLKKLRAEKIKK